MKLYLSKISDVLPRHRDLLTYERLMKAEKYKMPDDKKRCIAGGVLLWHFLGDTAITDNGYGKPVASDGTAFNLSHSGEWILLAVGEGKVGCDIERQKHISYEKMGRIVFTENELRLIKQARDKMGAFFKLWTKKEALLKCMGEGFHRPAKSVDVSGDSFVDGNRKYYLRTVVFADYVISACAADTDFEMDIEFVDLRQL